MRFFPACVVVGVLAARLSAQTETAPYGFSTIAGRAGTPGSTDGTGANARFYRPFGVAVDATGNVFVTDGTNHTVRKITPAGVVTTMAGMAGTTGTTDGTGDAARFGIIGSDPAYATGPFGITLDGAGNAFVVDGGNHTVRRVTSEGIVTTYAGRAGTAGFANGAIANALFRVPVGVVAASEGSFYVADTYNHVIRRISSTGVVTTIAGDVGDWGSADGIGQAARFLHPTAIAVDPAGLLYVADSNNTIRRLSPLGANLDTWSVTTIAGSPLTNGSVDGTGSAARFGKVQAPLPNFPSAVYFTTFSPPNLSVAFPPDTVYSMGDLPGLAVDRAGNVYVSDASNNTIRKMTPAGVVTTIAGSNNPGSADAVGTSAQFRSPAGIAIDAAGNLYIADFYNHTIRKGSPLAAPVIVSQPGNQSVAVGATVVLTVSVTGSPAPTFQWTRNGAVIAGASTSTLTLPNIQATQAGTYVAIALNSLGSVSTTPFTLTVGNSPVISQQPVAQSAVGGQTITLSVTATGSPTPTYQWQRNGIAIAGATSASLVLLNAQESTAGDYRVVVTNAGGSVTSSVAAITVNTSRIVNLSIRSALAGANSLFVGFVVSGGSKTLLVRAVGPGLRQFGVGTAMLDPSLMVRSPTLLLATNDNWSTATNAAQVSSASVLVGAFPLTSGSLDAASLVAVSNTAATAETSARMSTGGVVLLELYETGAISVARLVNVSTRAPVGTGENALFAGFAIAGNAPRTLLIRAVGPTLGSFGVSGVLADPLLEVFAGAETTTRASNDNWNGDAALTAMFARVGAFPLPSATSRDAALIITLDPGSYSVRVSGVANTTGEALVEIYEVP